jgi:hypothetical protein
MEKSKQIELKLSVDEVNIILESVGQMPFIKVFSLIEKIQHQAEQQLNDKISTENGVKESPEKIK